MNFRTMKMVAAFAVAFFGVAALSSNAQAQDTITANIEFDSAITTTNPTDLDFGTWLAIVRGGETVTLTMDNTAAITPGGITTSTFQPIAGTPAAGGIDVDLPTGTANVILQMSRQAVTAFTTNSAVMSLSAVTYSAAVEGTNLAFPVSPATVPVTVVAGGTPQHVTFGGTISLTGTPADGPDSASFDVSFAY